MNKKPTVSDEAHSACILAIVGSRDVHANAAASVIDDALMRHRPLLVVSGGAKASVASSRAGLVSIDTTGVTIAKAAGIQTHEFLPTRYVFHGPGGFQERNIKIADLCQCLVRIASTTTTTYGSGWTADYAEREGKQVERYTINEKGEITNG